MKIDETLSRIGGFGRHQKWIIFLLVFPSIVIGGYCLTLIQVLYTPNHRCKLPGYPNDTFAKQSEYHEELVNRSIPRIADTASYDRCHLYTVQDLDSNSTEVAWQRNASLATCHEWVYDNSVFFNTFSTKNNYVCDHKMKGSHIKMIFYFGLLVGDVVIGSISDTFGRKIGMFLGLMLILVSGILIMWASEFYSFSLLQFIIGFGAHGAMLCICVIEMEIVGPTHRMVPGMMIQVYFALGVCYVGLIGYLTRDFVWINLSLSVPCVALMSYWWLIPESPRWLLSKGRQTKGIEILRKTASVNKAGDVDEDVYNITIDKAGADCKLLDMFKTPALLGRELILCFAWLVISMAYYGVTMNAENLAGDFHLNFFLLGAAEIVGIAIGILVVDRIGRRWSSAGSLFVGGLACLATVPFSVWGHDDAGTATVILSVLGKVSVSATFGVIYIFTAEILPTVIRNVAMGTCSCAARTGAMIAPYIAKYGEILGGNFGAVVPLVVFGVLSLVAGILILLLPETLNQKLPDTLQDGERFGRPTTKSTS